MLNIRIIVLNNVIVNAIILFLSFLRLMLYVYIDF